MAFRHPHTDPVSERLLLVVLEEPQSFSTEFRHIRASVIRRAVPHTYASEADALAKNVQTWNDDHPDKCQGYRVASYVYPTASTNLYVDDMQLRGQIDAYPNGARLAEGRPYANRVTFKPYEVTYQEANAISQFFVKFGRYMEKQNESCNDDFVKHLARLAKFLKITRFVFHKPGIHHTSLESIGNLDEMNLVDAIIRIEAMLKPFSS